jgi:hypothetical protein
MMSDYDGRTKLEALRDRFEIISKGANYLLVGNSAGFVGCLSVLKDNPEKPPPQFHGIRPTRPSFWKRHIARLLVLGLDDVDNNQLRPSFPRKRRAKHGVGGFTQALRNDWPYTLMGLADSLRLPRSF